MERFILVTDGPINAHRFLVVDLEDTYHRTRAYATSWQEGTQLVEHLNRGAALEHLAAEVDGSVSVPRQGVKGDGGES